MDRQHATITLPSGKRTLWVVRAGPECPGELDFASLMIYSALVGRAKYGRPVSARQLAAASGIDYFRATPAALRTLRDLNLVERAGRRWLPLPPPGRWFSDRKGKSDKWWDKLGFFKVCVPKSSANRLPSRANAVYWLSASLLNRNRLWTMTQSGIGHLLRVPSVTVLRSQKLLLGLGLLKGRKCPLPPREEHLDLWADKQIKKTRSKPDLEKPDLSLIGRLLIDNYRVPFGLTGELVSLFERLEWSPEQARDYLVLVEGQSQVAVASGRQNVKHCGYLARHKLRSLLNDTDGLPPSIPAKNDFPWETPEARAELSPLIADIARWLYLPENTVAVWLAKLEAGTRGSNGNWQNVRINTMRCVHEAVGRIRKYPCQSLDTLESTYHDVAREYVQNGLKPFPNRQDAARPEPTSRAN